LVEQLKIGGIMVMPVNNSFEVRLIEANIFWFLPWPPDVEQPLSGKGKRPG